MVSMTQFGQSYSCQLDAMGENICTTFKGRGEKMVAFGGRTVFKRGLVIANKNLGYLKQEYPF